MYKWEVRRTIKAYFSFSFALSSFVPGWRTNTITTPKESKSQCSPCWSDEQLSPPQLYCTQTILHSPTEPSLPLGNSLCHSLLLSNNGSALHGQQRREVRPRVGGKKPPRRMYACFSSLMHFYIRPSWHDVVMLAFMTTITQER